METNKHIDESCEHPRSEHSHEHSEKVRYPPNGVTSNIHDGALVCSGNKQITGDLEHVKQHLEKEVALLDAWVEEREGITGHIKAIISVNGPVCRISATGGELESKNLGLKNIHVSIVAIVFQIDREIMENRIESLLERL